MNWQLIETAPKAPPRKQEGPVIMVFCDGVVGIARWQIINNDRSIGWWQYQAGPNDAAFNDYEPSPIARNPTHWASLPDGPA